jgi:small subunit ribosomal protein S2
MEKVLGGIAQLSRVPAALFLVDIGHEHIGLAEAKKLGITTFGMVDTNCDPNKVEFPIPSNDDATKSIAIVVEYITAAIAEGLAERQAEKVDETEETEESESGPKFELGSEEERERNRRSAGGGAPGRGRSSGPGGGGHGPGQRRRTTGGGPAGGGGGRRPGGGGGGPR